VKSIFLLLSVVALEALQGCAPGPNYSRPQLAVPSQWTAPAARGTLPGIEPETNLWWKSFQDPELDSLIERAVAANYDLKLATARVLEARAARGGAQSGFFPQVSEDAAGTHFRQFTATVIPSSGDKSGLAPPPTFETNNYRGAVDASWELDLFGRIRQGVNAATGDLAASEQDRRNVLVTLLGDVGRNYANLRGFQLRLAIAEQNIGVAEEALKLTRAQVEGGQATERDVAQAAAQLESVRAQVPSLNSNIAVEMHRLAVLAGEHPGVLDAELTTRAPVPVAPPEVPIGLPTDLLERRPDIRRAEAQLAAATARVKEAKADYFPRFTLLGSAGRQAEQLHDLTAGLGNIFMVGPSISLPVFTAGRIRSNVAVQKARAQEALDNLQSTVLTSFEETENALVIYANELDRRDRLEAVVSANQTALHLAEVQYRAGLTDFLSVLDSERDLYANQDLLAQSQAAIATDLISLYKALGGGWSILPEITTRH
jgi:multidrug efflux system outer membrane protein